MGAERHYFKNKDEKLIEEMSAFVFTACKEIGCWHAGHDQGYSVCTNPIMTPRRANSVLRNRRCPYATAGGKAEMSITTDENGSEVGFGRYRNKPDREATLPGQDIAKFLAKFFR